MGLTCSHHVDLSNVVETNSGPIQGRSYKLPDDREVDGYLGIPYAEPPIGPLRFQRPVPVKPWEHVKTCVQFGPRSPQVDEFFSQYLNIVGKDEAGCLTLNVLAPKWKNPEFPSGHPVMFWIHGGGFGIHSSSNYGDSSVARNLCIKDVVFVSINYRLGPLGFFTTGDKHCQGNMGLWDQTLALQWVRENISKFGGDPNNVTVFGQSAGAGSVDLLSLSPYSQNLFRRVIAMAGSAENEFAIRSKEAETMISQEFAKFVGYEGEVSDSEALMTFMRAQPINRLELGMTGMHEKKRFIQSQSGYLPFVPCLDGDFFPGPISELRRKMPKKQVMTGTTEWEGLFFAVLGNIKHTPDGMRKVARAAIKECDYGKEYQGVQKEIVDFYLGDTHHKDHEGITRKHLQMIGDLMICNGVFTYAKKMAHLGHDVYFYSFEYVNPEGFGVLKWLLPFKAATHCTEIRYVLGKGVISKFRPSEDDKKMIEIMTGFFTNFAKYGNPNGKDREKPWIRHSSSDPYRHMKICLEPTMADNYQNRRVDFWQNRVVSRNTVHPNLFGLLEYDILNKL